MAINSPAIPNTFTAGSSAKSAEVNANFTALRDSQAKFHAVAGDYTVLDTDGYRFIYVTAGGTGRTITLPTAADNEGRVITVKKVDAGIAQVSVVGEGSETVDLAAFGVQINQLNEFITVHCNGTTWRVIGGNVGRVVGDGSLAYQTTQGEFDFVFTATLTADLTISAYGMSSRVCSVPAIFEATGSYADEDFSVERPTITTLRLRVGITTTATFKAIVQGRGSYIP